MIILLILALALTTLSPRRTIGPILIAAAIAIGSIALAIGLGVLSSRQAQAGHVPPPALLI